jgi:hypothetical protein
MAEGEQPLDIFLLRHDPAGPRIDDIVKSQLQPPMWLVGMERLGRGPVRVEDRQDMGDAAGAVPDEFIEPTNRQPERQQHSLAHAFS